MAVLLRLRAAGEPTSIVELAPQPVAEDQNAAAHYRRLKPQLDNFSQDRAAFYKTPLGQACGALDVRGTLPTICAVSTSPVFDANKIILTPFLPAVHQMPRSPTASMTR